jgi:hypothetical protein
MVKDYEKELLWMRWVLIVLFLEVAVHAACTRKAALKEEAEGLTLHGHLHLSPPLASAMIHCSSRPGAEGSIFVTRNPASSMAFSISETCR